MGRKSKREALLRMEREMTSAEKELATLRQKISQATETFTADVQEGPPNGSHA